MEFGSENEQKDFLKNRKRKLALEARSEYFNLSSSDRFVLRNYYGYEDHFGIFKNRNLKKKDSASIFVEKCLWPNIEESQQTNEEFNAKAGGSFVPRLFVDGKKSGQTDSFDYFHEDWFRAGYDLTDENQISILRAFQSMDRVFDEDVCFNRFGLSTKIMMCGQVTEVTKYSGQTDRPSDRSPTDGTIFK